MISIHTLRVEGVNFIFIYKFREPIISIHTLRVEGDGKLDNTIGSVKRISIHTLRVEGDNSKYDSSNVETDFNPHPPCGG